MKLAGFHQCRASVLRHAYLLPQPFQHAAQQEGRVALIVDDQHAQSRLGAG
jgi:hypothetical protein